MVSKESMQRLLAPQHIAFIGGRAMADALKRCRAGGFEGDLWLVNPRQPEIDGERCYATVADLPAAPDASFIATNRDLAVDVVAQLSAIGAGGAVCYASGFAEAGEQGARLQQQLIEAAGDMAIIGPNCYGLLDYLHGASLWPVAFGGERVEKGMAILTQSGNFAYNLSMADRSLPIAYMISVGNQASVDVAALIDALLDEPRVTAIGLHLEGLKDIPAFAKTALKALQKGIPIVALKTGRSEIGAELALSHTSSLAGSDELYTTLFEQTGVIRVSGPVSFMETLKVLSLDSLPSGNRVAALACSGGDAGLIADYSEENGLQLPSLNNSQEQALAEVLPEFANITNPMDFTTAIWGDEQALSRVADEMFSGDSGFKCDFGFLVLDYPSEETGERPECDLMAKVFIEALNKRKIHGAVASAFPELMPASARKLLHDNGVPAFQGVEEGLAAVGRAANYVQQRKKILADQQRVKQSMLTIDSLNGNVRVLDEWQSKRLLADFGLEVPCAKLVARDQINDALKELSLPLVAKVVSADLPHKTEAGAVAVNLKTEQEVIAAVDLMQSKVSASHPDIDCSQILLEQMAPAPVAELIVGIKREPGFGLALVVGAGGILVELVKDSATLLLPVTETMVRDALSRLKIYPLLQGFRGKSGGDIDAVVEAVMAVANFATEHAHSLAELDVNPLMVSAEGAVAVDALVRLCDASD